MTQPCFTFLSEADHQALFAQARRLTYPAGAVILEEGSQRRSLFVVQRGYVNIQRNHHGRGITLARLGPGAFFGEMSLLQQTSASASIVAAEDAVIDEIVEPHVHALLTSVPGFAARFYQSLSTEMAHRLRVASQQLTALNVSDVAQVNRFHTPRTGNIGARQIPVALTMELRTARRTLDGVEEALRSNQLSIPQAQTQVAQACDRIVTALGHLTQDDTLLEIGWADLLAFRDTAQLETGLGAYVFRETFPIFMSSTTMARCYMKPRGYPDDFETMQMLCGHVPEGDGLLGRFVDAWFLARPLCHARRHARRQIGQMLQDVGRVPVTSLACGAAVELDALHSSMATQPYVTCLDIDTAVLEHLALRTEQAGLQNTCHVVHGNVTSITAGHTLCPLAPQQLIYALDLCDYLEDDQIVVLLNWAYAHLASGGSVVLSNLMPGHLDADLMTHILEWQVVLRSPEHWRALFAQSSFATTGRPLEISVLEPGNMLLARGIR